jgi:hypothetical protein
MFGKKNRVMNPVLQIVNLKFKSLREITPSRQI